MIGPVTVQLALLPIGEPAGWFPAFPLPSVCGMTDTNIRPVLWLILIVSAAANSVLSSLGAMLAGMVFGAIALASAVTLIVHHYRHRRSSPRSASPPTSGGHIG